jgi:hypothetical protein
VKWRALTSWPSTTLNTIATCRFFNSDILVRAGKMPPVRIDLFLTITPEEIGRELGSFRAPNFNTVAVPFRAWMAERHPDDADKVGFGNWTSIQEAEANGLLNVQYSEEWATYPDTNGCTYGDGC